MNFLYPNFLWALLALAVPVAIHLFAFRRYKTIYFSNVRFLADIERHTKKQTHLKHIVLLLLRMLILSALIVAFAMPYIPATPNKNTDNEREIVIYIDNSFSMESVNQKGSLLEDAKSNALQLIKQLPAHFRYFLFTNNYTPGQYHPKSKAETIREISSIDPAPFPADFKKLVQAEMNATRQKSGKLILFSDFQTNSSNLAAFQKDTTKNILLYPVPTLPTGNLYIDSCQFVSPIHQIGHKEELITWISNQSNEDLTQVPLKLLINDSLAAMANFSIKAGMHEQVLLKFTNSKSGTRQGKLLIPDYPVTYDNEFFLTWNVEEKRKVLVILGKTPLQKEASQIISALFENDSFIHLKTVKEDEIKISELPKYSTIILANLQRFPTGLSHELKKYTQQGGNIVVFPEFSTNKNELNNFLAAISAPQIDRFDTLKTNIHQINSSHPVYKDVFSQNNLEFSPIPVSAYFHWKITTTQKGYSLIEMNNRQPAVFTLPVGNGNLSLFSFPLQNNPFFRHNLFVSTVYNLLFYTHYHPPILHIIGNESHLTIANFTPTHQYLPITNLNTGTTFYPETTISSDNKVIIHTENQIDIAGFYQIGDQNNVVAFNYNRKESDLRCLSPEEIQHQIQKLNLTNTYISTPNNALTDAKILQIQDKILWKWFLAAALLFLFLEGIMRRFWR